ncbi:hypothetical protein MRX96_051216, partial [Rhipicephalus microplus]
SLRESSIETGYLGRHGPQDELCRSLSVRGQEAQRKVLAEHDIYEDVVQGDFIDSCENLTYVTTMLIRWTRAKGSKAEFGLKINGDMILSVYDFAIVVNGLERFKRSMWSYFYRDHGPNRNVDCKLYGSQEEYAPDTYQTSLGRGI